MGRTRTQLRVLTAQQLVPAGLPYTSATTTATGTTTITDADALGRHPNDSLIGYYVYLSVGSFEHLRITDNVQSTGVVTFIPAISDPADAIAYEILPFAADTIHAALDEALLMAHDAGLISRTFWLRGVTGSPIYNGDFSYWTSSSALDGWTATTATLVRSQAAADKWVNENLARLTTANGTLALDTVWRRFLQDFAGGTIHLRAWVKTSTASAARINFVNDSGTATNSSFHSGDGDWELLSNENIALDQSEINWYPQFERAAAGNVDIGEIWVEGPETPSLHPFPVALMPDGPDEIYASSLGVDTTNLRGRVTPDRMTPLYGWDWIKYHDEAADVELGAIVWRDKPAPGNRMLLRVNGPVTLPTADTSVVELNQMESLLVCKMAALSLLQKNSARVGSSAQQRMFLHMQVLAGDIEKLSKGLGDTDQVVSLGPVW